MSAYTCILHTSESPDLKGLTWCGRHPGFDFTFVSIDHAAYNGLKDGRLVACPKCVDAVASAINGNS